jgi:hypothetical protein
LDVLTTVPIIGSRITLWVVGSAKTAPAKKKADAEEVMSLRDDACAIA